jgi:hypothetical protein
MGLDFLDFLRSGEKDIHAFVESRRRRRLSWLARNGRVATTIAQCFTLTYSTQCY